ncbi:ABC transporter substrate-binding protein [Streptomonospora litoralis]|uniref:Nickel-binding periplasmic protein n=1 Tax=Streptomonospora litoralis TaxID=2498135 RepID=A0A4P6Q7J5_9ACTN|nr:ABC transporter substrate-binding protein [Streptomonospora litoralis]QBI56683.1 Nickel-binding periplasmic protein precursor [Streptomonospora litoralis]
MSGTRYRTGTAAVLGMAVLAATACTTGGTGAGGAGTADGTVRLAVSGDATTFDPARGNASTDYEFARLAYDTLLSFDTDGELVPGLAKSWENTPTEATFTLRDGVTCSNGEKLTATMVADTLRHIADPETGSSARYLVFGPHEPTITADDEAGKVTIELDGPWSDLPVGLAGSTASITCSDDPEKLNSGGAPGTGPYTLTESKRGATYTFTRRDDYDWAPEHGGGISGKRPEKLVYQVISNESTVANQLETGALDYATFTGTEAQRFTDGDYTSLSRPTVHMFLVFNQREGRPGADPEVREAAAQAVDRAAFDEATTGGAGTLLTSVMSDRIRCVLDDESLLTGQDKQAAAEGLDGVDVKLVGTNAVAGGNGNEYVRAALEEAGASVDLRNIDNASWATDVLGNQGDWDMTVMAALNSSGVLTPTMSLLSGAEPPQGRNFAGVHNDKLDQGFADALSTTDAGEKCAAWERAQRAMLKRHDVVPLSTVDVSFVMAPGISAAAFPAGVDTSTLRIEG